MLLFPYQPQCLRFIVIDSTLSALALDGYQVREQAKNMQEGIIAGLTDRGFGFIRIEGRAKDLFFHSNELVNGSFDSLREGDKVTFEITEGPKGEQASKVSTV